MKPGEVITAAEAEQVRALFPLEIWEHAVRGFEGLELIIAPSGDYTPHAKYVEATAKFACQAHLDEHGQLQGHVAGQPFPYSAWAREATGHACDLDPEDPQAGLKLAWNVNHRWTGGGTLLYPHWGQSYQRSDGDDTWKLAQGSYRRTWFAHRADLLPERTELVPGSDIEWAEHTETAAPFDLRGQGALIFRYKNSYKKRDDAWVYVPELRRVRRLSTSEKADSVQGSELTYEDFFLFSGYIWDHEWRFEGEHDMLVAADTERECFPKNVPGWQPDRLAQLGTREHFEACRFGPWNTLPLVGERWQVRRVVRLVQIPKWEDHPYSRRILWYDAQSLAPLLYFAYGRDGKPSRVGWYISDWSESSDVPGNRGARTLIPVAYLVVTFDAGSTNRSLFFTAHVAEDGPEEALRAFDVTRLKRGR